MLGFQLTPNYGCPADFYSVSAKTWVHQVCNTQVHFYEDEATTGIRYFGATGDTPYRGLLQYLDTEGNKFYTPLYPEHGWNWASNFVQNERICLLEEYKSFLIACHIAGIGEDDTFYKIDDKYADKIIWDNVSEELKFNNGRIALPLRGSDRNLYVAVFDTQRNVIREPIQATILSNYSDGMLILDVNGDTTVFDTNGQYVFTIAELGYSKLEAFADGVARVDDSSNSPVCLDKNGATIFDQVNVSEVATKNIPST